MLNVKLICVGDLKESYLREAAAEYEKRLGAYCRFSTVVVKDDTKILPLPARSYKIALCVEGKQLSSPELASHIADVQSRGYSEIILIIGGAEGMDERIKSECDLKLSFSKMTFPHPLMRVILLEQLYRALNINSNGNYHK